MIVGCTRASIVISLTTTVFWIRLWDSSHWPTRGRLDYMAIQTTDDAHVTWVMWISVSQLVFIGCILLHPTRSIQRLSLDQIGKFIILIAFPEKRSITDFRFQLIGRSLNWVNKIQFYCLFALFAVNGVQWMVFIERYSLVPTKHCSINTALPKLSQMLSKLF